MEEKHGGHTRRRKIESDSDDQELPRVLAPAGHRTPLSAVDIAETPMAVETPIPMAVDAARPSFSDLVAALGTPAGGRGFHGPALTPSTPLGLKRRPISISDSLARSPSSVMGSKTERVPASNSMLSLAETERYLTCAVSDIECAIGQAYHTILTLAEAAADLSDAGGLHALRRFISLPLLNFISLPLLNSFLSIVIFASCSVRKSISGGKWCFNASFNPR